MNKAQALAALDSMGEGWIAHGSGEHTDDWTVREKTANDECHDCVEVTVFVRPETNFGEYTDEDWMNLGKFVGEVAAGIAARR